MNKYELIIILSYYATAYEIEVGAMAASSPLVQCGFGTANIQSTTPLSHDKDMILACTGTGCCSCDSSHCKAKAKAPSMCTNACVCVGLTWTVRQVLVLRPKPMMPCSYDHDMAWAAADSNSSHCWTCVLIAIWDLTAATVAGRPIRDSCHVMINRIIDLLLAPIHVLLYDMHM